TACLVFLDVAVDIVESWALYPGEVEEAAFSFVIEEGAAELADPEDVALLDLIHLADAEPAELADRLPILRMRRGTESESRRHGGRRDDMLDCEVHACSSRPDVAPWVAADYSLATAARTGSLCDMASLCEPLHTGKNFSSLPPDLRLQAPARASPSNRPRPSLPPACWRAC